MTPDEQIADHEGRIRHLEMMCAEMNAHMGLISKAARLVVVILGASLGVDISGVQM